MSDGSAVQRLWRALIRRKVVRVAVVYVVTGCIIGLAARVPEYAKYKRTAAE